MRRPSPVGRWYGADLIRLPIKIPSSLWPLLGTPLILGLLKLRRLLVVQGGPSLLRTANPLMIISSFVNKVNLFLPCLDPETILSWYPMMPMRLSLMCSLYRGFPNPLNVPPRSRLET